MTQTIRRLSLALLSIALLQAATIAQDAAPKMFPPKGWKAVDGDDLSVASVSMFDATKGLKIKHLKPPAEWTKAVATDGAGKVVAYGRADEWLVLTGLDVGASYRIYLSQPNNKRYTLLDEDFIECQEDALPNKTWLAQRNAKLPMKSVKQKTPKNVGEMMFGGVAHQIQFKTAKTKQPCLYVMCHVQDDGTHKVVSQSLTPTVRFWTKAKKGDRFCIYQLFAHDHSFRVSKELKVDKDSPWGK